MTKFDIHDIAMAVRLAAVTLVAAASFALLSCSPAPATAATKPKDVPAIVLPTKAGNLVLYFAAGGCKVGLAASLAGPDGRVAGCWDADQGQAVVALADGRKLEVDLAAALGDGLGLRV